MLDKELAIVFIDSFDFFTYKKKQLFFELFENYEDVFNYQ